MINTYPELFAFPLDLDKVHPAMKKSKSRYLLIVSALIVAGYLALPTERPALRPQLTTASESTAGTNGQKPTPGKQTPLLDAWSRVRRKIRSLF